MSDSEHRTSDDATPGKWQQRCVNMRRGPFRPLYVNKLVPQLRSIPVLVAYMISIGLIWYWTTGHVIATDAPRSASREFLRNAGTLTYTILVPAILVCHGFWLRWLKRRTLACWTLGDIAERTGMPADLLKHVIDMNEIDPRFIVGGIPVYEPWRLTNAAILLRPTDFGINNDLLRPATGNSIGDSALVRPAATEGEAMELASLVGVPPIVLPDEAQEQGRR